jgi:hypothetical protein
LVGLALFLGLLLLPGTPARAETSYHKLKKRLRKVERTTGQVLKVAGAVTVYVVCEGALLLLDSAANDTDCSPQFQVSSKPHSEPPAKHLPVKGKSVHKAPGH